MVKPRYSIRALLIAITVSGFSIFATQHQVFASAAAMMAVTLGFLCAAVSLAIFATSYVRRFWTTVSIFGWCYFLIGHLPQSRNFRGFPSWYVSELLAKDNAQQGFFTLPIAHCLSTLVFSLFGGMLVMMVTSGGRSDI